MVKSLRWRLQIWQAAILGLVVIGFGTVIYFQVQRSALDEIDAELLGGARILEGVMRTMPGDLLEHGFMLPPRPRNDRRPPNGRPNPDRPAQPRTLSSVPEPWDQALQLPPLMLQPRGPQDQLAYFAIYSGDRRLIKAIPPEMASGWYMPRQPVQFRVVDFRREVVLHGPHETSIIVGKDIRPQFDRMRWLAIRLALTGLGVMGVGLMGGWWMSGSAIRPIQQINQTVAKINASNLAARIDVQMMDRELRDLATILNSMWSRLEQAFEQQVRFTADASHELRTPITVLLSHAELALARPRSASEYQETIATSLRAGERMKSLVEDLLVLARADAGKLALRKHPVDLKTIGEEAVSMQIPIAERSGVKLKCDGQRAIAWGDSERLSQVATNLIGNAIRYNRPGGQITVTTMASDGQAILRVSDTGVGISAQDIPHLFERFYRVDQARSRASGGSGLGLAICQSIVEAHDGSIVVQSELDVGSVFEIRIPQPPNKTEINKPLTLPGGIDPTWH